MSMARAMTASIIAFIVLEATKKRVQAVHNAGSSQYPLGAQRQLSDTSSVVSARSAFLRRQRKEEKTAETEQARDRGHRHIE